MSGKGAEIWTDLFQNTNSLPYHSTSHSTDNTQKTQKVWIKHLVKQSSLKYGTKIDQKYDFIVFQHDSLIVKLESKCFLKMHWKMHNKVFKIVLECICKNIL